MYKLPPLNLDYPPWNLHELKFMIFTSFEYIMEPKSGVI